MGDNVLIHQDVSEETILIVEDSRTMVSLLSRAIQKEFGLQAVICRTYAEAQDQLQNSDQVYFAALLDLNLPDAPNGEVVDLVTGKGIPAIVFTGEMSDDLRDIMWSKRIVDYVVKDNVDNIQQIMGIARRLKGNKDLNVLVVDDSSTSRTVIKDLLKVWNFNVLEATDGREALNILASHDKINLLITDYHMPKINGIELVKEVRRKFSKSRLPIIGISGVGGATTSAHFIKCGANDYMHKPFLTEELYCRVISNIETSEYIAAIKDLAERDYLTGIFNRRSFFSYGSKLFSSHQRGQIEIVLAMIDIDCFKDCNDKYGHSAGDEVLKFVAETLTDSFRDTDLVARFGGEEFCVACVDLAPEEIATVFEETRRAIEEAIIRIMDYKIRVSISVGVCAQHADSLDGMIKIADEMLYQAKKNGRNQVCIAD
ncbi:diguanylate cyclase [Desulfovibrio ferrophilus]|uniref:diguanylate cyclase n=1 Tax=Desulfovibrio ferrophilus TaxID=241368 RepID=A0A2Z6B305_9BACT|nr:diguanylate cyclase [Desulfovibrio ferrophilus]BBD09871.1 response regulator receiver modulated diguanylate cyclase [Desulfovibrio ferrophilus]